jgi:P27 family predicted phage terminase small subunit
MRGRKPIPTHLKVLRGNPGHQALRPEREPDYEAAVDIPEPPAFLMPVAKEEWRRIATGLYHLGLLTLVDENPLAAYCQAYARWVTAEASLAKMAERDLLTSGLMIKTTGGNAIQNPLVGTANKAASDMLRYAIEFGFTPAARARIAAGAPDGSAKSKFAGLIGGIGASEADAGRKAARRARYQVYRNPDGPERDGTGEAVQAGAVAEAVHPGHLRTAPDGAPGGAAGDSVDRQKKRQNVADRDPGAGAPDRAGIDPER